MFEEEEKENCKFSISINWTYLCLKMEIGPMVFEDETCTHGFEHMDGQKTMISLYFYILQQFKVFFFSRNDNQSTF